MEPIHRPDIVRMLESHDILPTLQRIEILHALMSQGTHLCADQIYAMVNRNRPETSRATVYNTLKLLVKKNLIREVFADPEKIFFDPITTPHYHFYDAASKELTNIDVESVQIPLLPQFDAAGIDIVIRSRA